MVNTDILVFPPHLSGCHWSDREAGQKTNRERHEHMKTLQDLLTAEERAAIRAPIQEARTFPRRAFVDQDFYQLEVEHALSESWLAVGFSFDVPSAGDIVVVDAIGFPVILVRNKDGVLRAFHNVCPYDGSEVSIRSQHGVEEIETPYHGLTYDLNGKLVRAGFWDGTQEAKSVDIAALNGDLVSVPCEEQFSTIFLYLGKEPVPLEEQYKPVFDHVKNVDLPRLEVGVDENGAPNTFELSIRSNWKTVYENYAVNVFHESFVHAMYRKSPHSPRVDENGNKTYDEINDPTGFLGLAYDNSIGASFYGESALPPVRNKDGSENRINTIANIYPNWVLTVLGNVVRIALFLPDGPESGTQRVMNMFDKDGATEPGLEPDRKQSLKAGKQARIEDNLICESVQRARHSPAVNSQFYSPFWDSMHYTLTNLILDKLEKSDPK